MTIDDHMEATWMDLGARLDHVTKAFAEAALEWETFDTRDERPPEGEPGYEAWFERQTRIAARWDKAVHELDDATRACASWARKWACLDRTLLTYSRAIVTIMEEAIFEGDTGRILTACADVTVLFCAMPRPVLADTPLAGFIAMRED